MGFTLRYIYHLFDTRNFLNKQTKVGTYLFGSLAISAEYLFLAKQSYLI